MRTVIADDHPIFRKGLCCHLAQLSQPAFNIVAETGNGRQALQACEEYEPELLVLDMNMPVLDGIGVLDALEEKATKPYTLVLSAYEHPKMIRAALDAGADGYLLKSAKLEDLHAAVKTLLKGETFISEGAQLNKPRSRRAKNGLSEKYAAVDVFVKKYNLTKRELEILELITQALSNKEIGKTLYISDQTVSVHRKNIMRKLGVSNTAGLIKTAYDHCLV